MKEMAPSPLEQSGLLVQSITPLENILSHFKRSVSFAFALSFGAITIAQHISAAPLSSDAIAQFGAEKRWGKDFTYELPTTGRLVEDCGIVMEIIKRPKDAPTAAGEKVFLLMRGPDNIVDFEDKSAVADFFRLFAWPEAAWCQVEVRSPRAAFAYKNMGLRVVILFSIVASLAAPPLLYVRRKRQISRLG